jgi:beta-ribofuranosylaminobenzene 5'-phosphate synthase
MAKRAIHVTAPARLHFGMLSFGQPGQRQFGGAGAMVSDPCLRLTIAGSDRFEVEGPLSERIEQLVEFIAQHTDWCRNLHIRVVSESAPPHHAGLGSGTQLGMALARGLAAWFDAPEQDAVSLARAVGRGKRSAIGVYGACLGGVIVESGKLADEEISPLLTRVELPDEWRFVLIIPGGAGLSGEEEQRAFDRLPPVPFATTAELCRELVCELVPAATQRNVDRFGEALYRYGRLAGQCFASQQGGFYASPTAEQLVKRCRELGVQGVGQSSWGPTIFALCRDQRHAEQLIGSLTTSGDLAGARTFLASLDNQGILVEA